LVEFLNEQIASNQNHFQRTTMPEEQLTAAEVRQHAKACYFSAAFCDDQEVHLSWVQTRGKVEKGGGDSGKDLVVMKRSGFPRIVRRGEDLVGGVVFSPSGRLFCFQKKDSLVWGCTTDGDLSTTCWFTLGAGEGFTGSPVWVGEDVVLFGVSSGEPKRDRLFFSPPLRDSQPPPTRTGPIFTAERGGTLMGWDAHERSVVVVHRLANAMLAEIVMVTSSAQGSFAPTVLAVHDKVEYCKPMAAVLASGALLLRLNALLLDNDNNHLRDASRLEILPPETQTIHGLWILDDLSPEGRLEPVHVMPAHDHGTYDVCSGSYGCLGTTEGFRLDSRRTRVVVTARKHTADSGSISYTDELFCLDFANEELCPRKIVTTTCDAEKGCKIPVAVSESELVYHFRSPTENGDLYLASLSASSSSEKPTTINTRLTETMPLSLKDKLIIPKEVIINNDNAPFRGKDSSGPLAIHSLLFTPRDGEDGNRPLQPILWLHGGPMCQYSFDFNPLLSWLASCGYLVLAPNFSGSTGNGLDFMSRVLGEGCGLADLSDCLACAKWLRNYKEKEPRLDLSRGIAVAGHSWGGYLAFMCMLESDTNGESVFSCGVAAAGITDWFVQQRHTEVRYYDYALMGGWVYEKEVQARARAVSPISKATNLRAPLLVLHGDKDQDVPFEQIPPFVQSAKSSPHPNACVEFHAYPGEGHGMSGTSEVQSDYLRRIQTFLRIHLKPWDFTSNPHGDLTAY